jgi:GH18 family chitinase
MRLLSIAALAGLASTASNVSFWGAPGLSLGDTLPNMDSSGHLIEQTVRINSVSAPTCGNTSGTASKGRTVAYYQAWNVRTNPCNKVWPAQIQTNGLTHLNLAFASIDPKSYKIRLQNSADAEVYRQFTDLKKRGVQTWLGVGGWEFSDEGETRTTWSDMVSTESNRKAFISTTLDMLKEYGFQGLDLDWEWPGASNRGGRDSDKEGHVALFKELRAAFGNDYGLTCALPHDYAFLKNIDVKGLSEHVDWFNVLTYDLHGTWDEKSPDLGPRMRSHTDLKEIDSHLSALWDTGVKPEKFTLGLAYYGRGYTAKSKDCLYYGCDFKGPSYKRPCTNQAGIISNCELKGLISKGTAKTGLIIGGAGAKHAYWDDQWVSYDDAETIALKKGLADERCMSGTAIWAIDYDTCEGEG